MKERSKESKIILGTQVIFNSFKGYRTFEIEFINVCNFDRCS
jgi:hypothetical protein